ncbi:MAG TPA: hypothetical protein VGH08_01780 [Chthoniobacterales bacterium]
MKQLFQLGNWFRTVCYLLSASSLLGVVTSTALAQVTVMPPFVGDHSETWEEFRIQPIPNGTSILGGIATISGPNMETAGPMMFECGEDHFGFVPIDGTNLMDSFFPSGSVTISFSQPVSAFGAYWGTCTEDKIILTFIDVNGQQIGSDTFGYAGSGALEWHGYQFATPVKTIIRANYLGHGMAMDGLQTIAAPAGPPLSLANISTRGLVGTGDQVMIGGFIIGGTAPKQVLIRAIGPSLVNLHVAGPLQDPILSLHDTTQEIASNDDWQSAANAGQIPINLQPQDARESAILISLAPGEYTGIVTGKGGTTGVGLVEVYDLDPNSGSNLANISTRGFVGTGDNVMIGGFIAGGPSNGSAQLLIRAIGPSLANLGVNGALNDPMLALFDANGQKFATNDNWKDNQDGEIQATGKAPIDDRESAILARLPSGSFTAIVSGVNNTTGIALIEVFNLD